MVTIPEYTFQTQGGPLTFNQGRDTVTLGGITDFTGSLDPIAGLFLSCVYFSRAPRKGSGNGNPKQPVPLGTWTLPASRQCRSKSIFGGGEETPFDLC